MDDEPISFRHIEEATIRHHQQHFHLENVHYYQETTSFQHRKIQKNLQVTSAENRGVTKSELLEVIHLIQNTMQTLSAFENCCSVQKNITQIQQTM